MNRSRQHPATPGAAGLLLLLAAAWPARVPAETAVTFEIIADGAATDISADGTTVVGLTADRREPWRWTRRTGQVVLGPAGSPERGLGPGTPDVSDDGALVSATVPGSGDAEARPGVWREETGWTPCGAPGAAAWGLSGDGTTVVGLVRDHGKSAGAALAAAWNRRDGLVALGSPGRNSRANDANLDGSVIVGWMEDPATGSRQPAAWTADGPVVLAATPAFCEAQAVSPDGRIIVGETFDDLRNLQVAAVWLRSDYGWIQEEIGALPGTLAGYGEATALDLSADGRVIVGVNHFDRNRTAGFVWTPSGGMREVQEFLTLAGAEIPADFTIDAVTGVSDDGSALTGHGRSTTDWPFTVRSFLVTAPPGVGLVVERPDDYRERDPAGDPRSGSLLNRSTRARIAPW